MEKLEKLFETAVGQYKDGLPLHLSDPTRSSISIMSAMDFECKTAGEIQELLRTKHLLISDCAKDTNFKFDQTGLDTLCMSMHPIEVQGTSLPRPPIHISYVTFVDQSVRVGEAGAGELWLTTAMTGQLLEAANTPDGKILNALEFPMGLASFDPPPKYSTDLLSLRVAGRGIVPPTSDIRWGTAATSGACTWFHLDSNGLGVSVNLKCRLKIWFFLKDDEGKLNVINCFEDFELDEANGYQLEAVVLRPGTQMFVDHLSPYTILTRKTWQVNASQYCSLGCYHVFCHLFW